MVYLTWLDGTCIVDVQSTIHMDMREYVVNRVFEARQKAGLTQEALAEAVGVTRQTIIALERGNYVPSVLLALKIAKCFRQPVEKIFMHHYAK